MSWPNWPVVFRGIRIVLPASHFIYCYMASDIWLKTFIDNKRKPAADTLCTTLPISSKGSFTCVIPQTG